MIRKYYKKIRGHFHEVAQGNTSEHSIGLGFAIGTAIGIIPTPGFGTLLGLMIVLIFKKLNKLSVFIGMAVWNPFVTSVVNILSYKIGDMFFGTVPLTKVHFTLADRIYDFTLRFLVGNLIISIIATISCYFIARLAIRIYRKRRDKKKKKIKHQKA